MFRPPLFFLFTIVLLFVVLATVSCATGSFPEFPDEIKDHYLVEVRDEEMHQDVILAVVNPEEVPEMTEVVRCIHFEIVSKIPYKIKFKAIEPMKECNGVGGYKPKDSVSLLNWIDDVKSWADKRKKCFK